MRRAILLLPTISRISHLYKKPGQADPTAGPNRITSWHLRSQGNARKPLVIGVLEPRLDFLIGITFYLLIHPQRQRALVSQDAFHYVFSSRPVRGSDALQKSATLTIYKHLFFQKSWALLQFFVARPKNSL